MSQDNQVNRFCHLNPQFLLDLRDAERVHFIFFMPSFLDGLSEFQNQVHQLMKRHKKTLSMENFPFFLNAGINIHYLTTIFLIDKYRHKIDSILDGIYSGDRLTKRGKELLKDILTCYSYDFKGFHQMMRKTYIFSRLASLNEYSLLEDVFEMYKDHPDELTDFLEGKDKTTVGTLKLFGYLHNPQILALFLKAIPANTLFAHEVLLPRILTISLTGSRYSSSFSDFLKKMDEMNENKKKTILYFLYCQNAHLFISSLTDERRLKFYEQKKGKFDILNEFITYGNKQSDACIFQNFFVNCMPKDLLENTLSEFDTKQLRNFIQLMLKTPITKEVIFCLRNLNIVKDEKQYNLLSYLNSKDLLSKEEFLKFACYMFQNDGYEQPVKKDLFELFCSFSSYKKGADFILSHPEEFIGIFYNSQKESSFLLKKYKMALFYLEQKKVSDLFNLKNYFNLDSAQFVDTLTVQDEHGNNVLHLACRQMDKTFFRSLNDEEWSLLKEFLFQPNYSAKICFDLAPVSFRKWLVERVENLKEPLSFYEKTIQLKKEEKTELEEKTLVEKKKIEPEAVCFPVLPKVRRLCAYSKLFKRDMKHLESSTDAREKDLFNQVKEKIEERCTASRENMQKILSDEWKTASLDLACFDLFDSQGTPYRVGYLVKNDRIMILKIAPRRDFYDEMTGSSYRQLMQEANEFLFANNTCINSGDDKQHE